MEIGKPNRKVESWPLKYPVPVRTNNPGKREGEEPKEPVRIPVRKKEPDKVPS